ncbi:ATP-grasp domain-containing protein [Peribacillus frigoritolerans]|uniref:ATP-grasp domain-containing protein n=1 Tax=Peribacillus frigoritolerans TaxID=450367 RepID=UPI00215B70B2|nr:ATP-grasp domain-containing protein [Peribacillus frigoritolerans]MCR8871006.1 ATP-grasp domain-containing protein [Peribacillus frigoritolerans]
MKKFTVLFTSSGRRVSLIQHFKDMLLNLNLDGKIITTDLKRTSPARFIADEHVTVPRVSSEDYISSLLHICRDHNVSLIVPLIDTELGVLSQNKEIFEEIGVTVLVSSPYVNEICFDKRKTAQFFTEAGFDTPIEYDVQEVINQESIAYPYLIKPAKGSSSVGVYKINNKKELEFFYEYLNEPVLQELVVGEEYTIDVLTDFNGEVITAVPRLRMETRAGEVSKGMTVRNFLLIKKAKEIVAKLPGAVGCITLQCFLTENNEVKFTEINPRFGGGFPLSLEAGADFPRHLVESLLGVKSDLDVNKWRDGLVMLRYDDAIFVNWKEIE